MSETVAVVAVHPDDETLGCGGCLLRHRDRGDATHWLLLTAMSAEDYPAEVRARRQSEIVAVAEAYGFAGIHSLSFPAAGLEVVPRRQLVAALSSKLRAIAPSLVYLPFPHDPHGDHRAAFEAAWSSLKTFRQPSVRRILMMETPSETDHAPPLAGTAFAPTVFADITGYLDKKLEIMTRYAGETGPAPFPRSAEAIRALATVRGAAAGCLCAEAFMLLKEII